MPVRFVRSYKVRKLFLDSLACGDSESLSASKAGATVREVRAWRKEDENFRKDWEEAEECGTDFIEDVATERAIKKSDSLMTLILKARRPDKYDRAGKMDIGVTVNVEGAKQKLLNKVARIKAQRILADGGSIEGLSVLKDELDEPLGLLPAVEHRGSAGE